MQEYGSVCVSITDLCLDELDMSFASEATPKKLMVITPRIVDPLGQKEQARTYDKHLALLLDGKKFLNLKGSLAQWLTFRTCYSAVAGWIPITAHVVIA